eukprot:5195774-Prymnesium_polylepis.1
MAARARGVSADPLNGAEPRRAAPPPPSRTSGWRWRWARPLEMLGRRCCACWTGRGRGGRAPEVEERRRRRGGVWRGAGGRGWRDHGRRAGGGTAGASSGVRRVARAPAAALCFGEHVQIPV